MTRRDETRVLRIRSIGGETIRAYLYSDGVTYLCQRNDIVHITRAGVRRLARQLGMKVSETDVE